MNDWTYWDRIVYDDNVPGLEMDRHLGLCHLCRTEHKPGAAPKRPITYCGACRHWFCAEHRHRWFERGVEAIRQMVGGRKLGCCGPREER